MGVKYQDATFRIAIGDYIHVEVSIHGCSNNDQVVPPQQLHDVAVTCQLLALAIEKIKIDTEAKP